MTSTATRPNPI